MRLTIAIPETQVVEAPALLRFARTAPDYDIEADDQGPSYVACFEDFLTSVQLCLLIERIAGADRLFTTLTPRMVGCPSADCS